MDTKSKKSRYRFAFKALAFCIALLGGLICVLAADNARDVLRFLQSSTYRDSGELEMRMHRVADAAFTTQVEYSGEEAIRRGDYLPANYADEIEADRLYDLSVIDVVYQINHGKLPTAQEHAFYEEQINAQAARDLEVHRNEIVSTQLFEYQEAADVLESAQELPFFVYPLAEQSAYRDQRDVMKQQPISDEYTFLLDGNQYVVCVAVTPEGIALGQKEYDASYATGRRAAVQFGAGLLLLIAGTAWLLYAAGRTPASDEVVLTPLDRLPLDVGALVLGLAACVLSYYGAWLALEDGFRELNPRVETALAFLLLAGAYLCAMLFFIPFVKRLKRGEVLRRTLIWTLVVRPLLALARMARAVERRASPTARTVGRFSIYALIAVLCLPLFLILVALDAGFFSIIPPAVIFLCDVAAMLVYSVRRATQTAKIAEGVGRARAGNMEEPIVGVTEPDLAQLAADVNEISAGLKTAVDEAVRSEQMKTELITNVSHDLKTPLTSIINYVDLLGKQELTPAQANEYVRVLGVKTERLKQLVEDLFEISKAHSGQITVKPEPLCLNDLLAQALSECGERLEQKGLQVIVGGGTEKITVFADGNRLWRVFSNLLGNVAKYALDGSRVYIDLSRDETHAQIVFKNISNYPMNFDVSQITQRFVRGDASRTTEGSGLGLSIADSFLKLQGGTLDVAVDGDLFKATVRLPLA